MSDADVGIGQPSGKLMSDSDVGLSDADVGISAPTEADVPGQIHLNIPGVGSFKPSLIGALKGLFEAGKSEVTLPGDVYAGRVNPMSDEGSGKPKGTRTRVHLQGKFISALAADFEEHGYGAIRICRIEDPVNYLRLIASILPKELVVEARAVEGMSDEELKAALEAIGQFTEPRLEGDQVH